jgi:ribosomal protein S18 acetylase RimI-like enzyme
MTAEDVEFGMRLKEQAGWNQTRTDWLHLIEHEPGGVFLAEVAPSFAPSELRRALSSVALAEEDAESHLPAGTAACLRYGGRLGWIGMVLVAPELRRRGIATRLVDRCVEYLRDRGADTIRLDATPEGSTVYERLGFRRESALARFGGVASRALDEAVKRLRGRSSEEADEVDKVEEVEIATMRECDLEEVAAFDAACFGADRTRVLAGLLADWPEACRVLRRGGEVFGFSMARRGANAHQVGPCAASTGEGPPTREVLALLAASLGAVAGSSGPDDPVFADVVVDNSWALSLIEALGFAELDSTPCRVNPELGRHGQGGGTRRWFCPEWRRRQKRTSRVA